MAINPRSGRFSAFPANQNTSNNQSKLPQSPATGSVAGAGAKAGFCARQSTVWMSQYVKSVEITGDREEDMETLGRWLMEHAAYKGEYHLT
jgi:predicted trehalose synthase